MNHLLKSFSQRNYRLFFFSGAVSLTGAWMQMTAMPWLVYRLTNSALILGLIGFLSQIFILLLSPVAGTIADHYDKKKLLTLTQTLAMVQALILAALVLSGTVRLWHIIVLATLLGLINAFDMPIRQSFVVQLVGRENLMNAIGLNSFLFNGARIVGPAIAGIIIAGAGEGMCFLINGLSFIAVIAALFFIKPLPMRNSADNQGIFDKFISGFKYVRHSADILPLLVLLSITGLTGMFPMILMPVIIKDIFMMDASGLGLFMSAMGVGALIGTVKVASRKSMDRIKNSIFTAAVAFAALITAFAFVDFVPIALILLVAMGYFISTQMALTNTFVQMAVTDEMRGRVMGFFVTAFMGFAPIGSLFAGALAHSFGAPATMASGGVISVAAAFMLRKRIFKYEVKI
ncbi:MAG: MFS transporter [Elusimicrobiota bacterium]